ncbi:MAG: mannose-1-phosphate guanylyltransferase/mannose-6-phosphate isomerase [Gammaproteobacteria bacterium]|nr:mannose-1-phosphate guanylyltransferase/mannose-6-phosphate isomerase [Gammaproteobacteria bacterium]
MTAGKVVPVIMAGGVGSRLWPVSRKLYPKQFVSFQPGSASLFQQSLLRLADYPDLGAPIVVCNAEHRFLVAEQIRSLDPLSDDNDVTIILEPEGRNTAPAVALAALAAELKEENVVLLVLAADHLIENTEEFHKVIAAGTALALNDKLVTFGIVPQKPETGYGYIKRGYSLADGFVVDSFVEKPDLETAQQYLESGEYYWNSGMFMFTAKTYMDSLEANAPDILKVCRDAWAQCKNDLDFKRIPGQIFEQCRADSIDYAVMEKTYDGVVIPLDAGWNDLGAWSALWEQSEADEAGNVTLGDVILDDVKNSYIHAESRLVSIIGMDDTVVVETPDVVLVSDKNRVQEVKNIVDTIKSSGRQEADAHVRVYRPWGSYESLACGMGFQVKRIIVNPGASLSLQMHHHRTEHWIVVQGNALVVNGDEEINLQKNQSTYIPTETRHRLENKGDEELVLIEVQCGEYLGEDDIVRFDDIYGRTQT